jgi:hypothetical protein
VCNGGVSFAIRLEDGREQTAVFVSCRVWRFKATKCGVISLCSLAGVSWQLVLARRGARIAVVERDKKRPSYSVDDE